MDVYELLRELSEEKGRLDRLIASLEKIEGTTYSKSIKSRSRRGRKFMDARERREVSERMTKYWAARRTKRITGQRPNTGATSASTDCE